jgi:excisionase family DNA binding protein
VYNAKEAMNRLNLPSTTFYRKVREGKIPYKGRRPSMRFPKEAIDTMAELKYAKAGIIKPTFKQSTLADEWTKEEFSRQVHSVDDIIPFKTLVTLRDINEKISMQVNEGAKILGWTTFLPLEEGIILELVEGKRKHKDIPPQAVRKWEDTQISVYISTLEAVQSTNNTRDKVAAAFLIRKAIKWALTIREESDIKNWYAIATSRQGQAILEALGFTHTTTLDGGQRKGFKLNDQSKPSKLLKSFLRKR